MARLKGFVAYEVDIKGRNKEHTWTWNCLEDVRKHVKVPRIEVYNLILMYNGSLWDTVHWRDLALVKSNCRCGRCHGDHLWYYPGGTFANDTSGTPRHGDAYVDIYELFKGSFRNTYLPARFVDGLMTFVKTPEAVEYLETQKRIRDLLLENARLERKYDVRPGESFVREVSESLGRKKKKRRGRKSA